MTLSATFRYYAVAVAFLWSIAFTCTAQDQNEATMKTKLKAMLSNRIYMIEATAPNLAKELQEAYGQNEAVSILVSFVAQENLAGDQLTAASFIGRNLQPAFSVETQKQLASSSDPFCDGRLIRLLRVAPSEVVATALPPLLKDQRIAEHLTEHQIGEGATPFRVCDIAYNVLQESKVSNISAAPQVHRSDANSIRDSAIAAVVNLSPPSPQNATMGNTNPPSFTSPAEAPQSVKPGPAATPVSQQSIASSNSNEQSTRVWWWYGCIAAFVAILLFIWARTRH